MSCVCLQQKTNEIVYVPDQLKLLELQSLDIPLNFQLDPSTTKSNGQQNDDFSGFCSLTTSDFTVPTKENTTRKVKKHPNSKNLKKKEKFKRLYDDLFSIIKKHKETEKKIFRDIEQSFEETKQVANLIKRRKEYLRMVYGKNRKLENLYSPQQIKRILLRRTISQKNFNHF
ncbi:hypothetical protein M0813_00350 [Anaeramoeba flamelloides]|uniref:Uncharacterized protein n=1 Tax=Anaeramoeba flamelloides TaxID=1746091 RepID=A0ABQ8YA03_9EUKA|nr:hypothetical protein M0813_00350 [Anaeramoeba flamelloides]